MRTQELDRSRLYGFVEPDSGSLSIEGARRIGRSYAAVIKQWMSANGRELPADAKYLGLAAGESFPEIAFARHLGIKLPNVTLVDRAFRLDVRSRLEHTCPGPTLVDSGLFTYLAQAIDQVDVITAFGVEYIFRSQGDVQTLASLASRVLVPEGYLVIGPCEPTFPRTPGWTNIHPDRKGVLFLTFSGQPNLPKSR